MQATYHAKHNTGSYIKNGDLTNYFRRDVLSSAIFVTNIDDYTVDEYCDLLASEGLEHPGVSRASAHDHHT